MDSECAIQGRVIILKLCHLANVAVNYEPISFVNDQLITKKNYSKELKSFMLIFKSQMCCAIQQSVCFLAAEQAENTWGMLCAFWSWLL